MLGYSAATKRWICCSHGGYPGTLSPTLWSGSSSDLYGWKTGPVTRRLPGFVASDSPVSRSIWLWVYTKWNCLNLPLH
jgi:hypothetical protein